MERMPIETALKRIHSEMLLSHASILRICWHISCQAILAVGIGTCLTYGSESTVSLSDAPFFKQIAARVAQAKQAEALAIRGKDGWLFFRPELRHLSVGKFWGDEASAVSRASKLKYADPLPAIVDFHGQLRSAGIQFLFVPVPAKAAIYPEKISDDDRPSRVDVVHQKFFRELRSHGVDVIDLTPVFRKERNDTAGPLFCRGDTHWSSRGSYLASQLIYEHIQKQPWLKDVTPRKRYTSQTRDVKITGDLARMVDSANPASETLPLICVTTQASSGSQFVETWRESPVLLMGDSHTLVFHDPTLHASGAGLADHLALELGFPVDLIGVRGSGASATRVTLLRRRDNLAGKKLVIWCLSVREFTESYSGWRKVPVVRE